MNLNATVLEGCLSMFCTQAKDGGQSNAAGRKKTLEQTMQLVNNQRNPEEKRKQRVYMYIYIIPPLWISINPPSKLTFLEWLSTYNPPSPWLF